MTCTTWCCAFSMKVKIMSLKTFSAIALGSLASGATEYTRQSKQEKLTSATKDLMNQTDSKLGKFAIAFAGVVGSVGINLEANKKKERIKSAVRSSLS